MRKTKPIRVFYSPFSHRFYATRHYRDEGSGLITVTGEKFDVTQDIARLIAENQITFRALPEEPERDEAAVRECSPN